MPAECRRSPVGASFRGILTILNWIRILLCIFSASSIFNAGWMLVAPQHWYQNLPAHVPEYGPLNTHFVRDIGVAFLISGIGLAFAAVRPIERRACVLFAVSFFVGHALVHLSEVFTGGAAAHLWKGELLLVYLPALMLAAVTIKLYRSA
jgi:hypothetical protein